MAKVEVLEYINTLEKKLKIRTGFFVDLLKEDNWSFVIKLHSLIEAALTHLLVTKINKPELEKRLTKLSITQKKGFLDRPRPFRIL